MRHLCEKSVGLALSSKLEQAYSGAFLTNAKE